MRRFSGRIFWWVCALGAPPVAWLLAANGHGIPVVAPLRDVSFLTLWAVAEEIVFRGCVQPALAGWQRVARRRDGHTRDRPLGISPANLITSILFSAAHLWNRPLWLALGVMPVSLLLGASLERSGRLAVPVALHVYFNLVLYAASLLQAA